MNKETEDIFKELMKVANGNQNYCSFYKKESSLLLHYYKDLNNKIYDLKQENEKFKEKIQYVRTDNEIQYKNIMFLSKVADNLQEELEIMIKDDERSQESIIKLSKENERLSVELNTCMIERNNFLSRNEKAIEYVERVCESEKNINPYILHAPTLLNILQGSDK